MQVARWPGSLCMAHLWHGNLNICWRQSNIEVSLGRNRALPQPRMPSCVGSIPAGGGGLRRWKILAHSLCRSFSPPLMSLCSTLKLLFPFSWCECLSWSVCHSIPLTGCVLPKRECLAGLFLIFVPNISHVTFVSMEDLPLLWEGTHFNKPVFLHRCLP